MRGGNSALPQDNPWIPPELWTPAASGAADSKAGQRRRESRYTVDQPGQLVGLGRLAGIWAVRIRDISATGMQLMVEEAVLTDPRVQVRWKERRVNGVIRYNHKYDATSHRIGVELDARSEALMHEVLTHQSEHDSHLTLQRQAALSGRYQTLLDLASEAIAVFSPEGVVLFWNQQAERLYGWTRAEIIGRNIRQLLQPDLPWEVMTDGEAQLRQYRKNGSLVTVASRWITERDAEGTCQAVLCFTREVSRT